MRATHAFIMFGLGLVLLIRVAPGRPDPAPQYDCGANSLYILGNLTGRTVSYSRCCELLPKGPRGNSLDEMQRAVTAIGFQAQAVRIAPSELTGLAVPAVLLWFPPQAGVGAMGHFSV